MTEDRQTFLGPKTRAGNLTLAAYIGLFAVVFGAQWLGSDTLRDHIINGAGASVSALGVIYFGVRAWRLTP